MCSAPPTPDNHFTATEHIANADFAGHDMHPDILAESLDHMYVETEQVLDILGNALSETTNLSADDRSVPLSEVWSGRPESRVIDMDNYLLEGDLFEESMDDFLGGGPSNSQGVRQDGSGDNVGLQLAEDSDLSDADNSEFASLRYGGIDVGGKYS